MASLQNWKDLYSELCSLIENVDGIRWQDLGIIRFHSWKQNTPKNQSDAFEFLGLLNDINAILHGSEGNNFSSMRRISFNPVDTGGAGNLYLQTYSAILIDYSAQKAITNAPANPLNDVVVNDNMPIFAAGNGYSLD